MEYFRSIRSKAAKREEVLIIFGVLGMMIKFWSEYGKAQAVPVLF